MVVPYRPPGWGPTGWVSPSVEEIDAFIDDLAAKLGVRTARLQDLINQAAAERVQTEAAELEAGAQGEAGESGGAR